MRLILATAFSLTALPLCAAELTGPDLLSEISGRHFDCMMGERALEWIIAPVAADATTVPYSAIVGGKTVEASYAVNDKGRLTSDGYGEEREVTREADGALRVARADGRVMLCTAR